MRETDADPRRILIDPQRYECFLVPEDVHLPAGDRRVSDVFGRVRLVDAAALAPYAVPRGEVADRILGRVLDTLRAARATFREHLHREPDPIVPIGAESEGLPGGGESRLLQEIELTRFTASRIVSAIGAAANRVVDEVRRAAAPAVSRGAGSTTTERFKN